MLYRLFEVSLIALANSASDDIGGLLQRFDSTKTISTDHTVYPDLKETGSAYGSAYGSMDDMSAHVDEMKDGILYRNGRIAGHFMHSNIPWGDTPIHNLANESLRPDFAVQRTIPCPFLGMLVNEAIIDANHFLNVVGVTLLQEAVNVKLRKLEFLHVTLEDTFGTVKAVDSNGKECDWMNREGALCVSPLTPTSLEGSELEHISSTGINDCETDWNDCQYVDVAIPFPNNKTYTRKIFTCNSPGLADCRPHLPNGVLFDKIFAMIDADNDQCISITELEAYEKNGYWRDEHPSTEVHGLGKTKVHGSIMDGYIKLVKGFADGHVDKTDHSECLFLDWMRSIVVDRKFPSKWTKMKWIETARTFLGADSSGDYSVGWYGR